MLEKFGGIGAPANVAGAVPQKDFFVMTDKVCSDGMSLKFHGARPLTPGAWEARKAPWC